MNSPEYVNTSLAGVMALGLNEAVFYRNARLTCLNLLLTYEEGCSANCAYCGLARSRSRDKTFIRVPWSAYPLEELLDRVRTYPHGLRRACVSMITHRRALDDLCLVARAIRDGTDLPVSALLTPTASASGTQWLQKVREAGVDRIGIAIDAATKELFDRYRGAGVAGPHDWEHYWRSLASGVDVFGAGMVGIHLIVGLGETERQAVAAIQRAQDMGASTHLFSFFPERGTNMENHPQPPLGNYRRVQLARFLINEGLSCVESMAFDPEGRVVDFGLAPGRLAAVVASGAPFLTSGCPGSGGVSACNRPYGNERPSEPMRNFPFAPESPDIKDIEEQILRY